MQTEQALAFKVGFLTKVAEAGYEPEAFVDLIKKALSISDLGGPASQVAKGFGGLLGGVGKVTLGAAAGAPILAGGALGALDANAAAPSQDDFDNLHKQEMLSLLTRLTNEVNNRRARKDSE